MHACCGMWLDVVGGKVLRSHCPDWPTTYFFLVAYWLTLKNAYWLTLFCHASLCHLELVCLF